MNSEVRRFKAITGGYLEEMHRLFPQEASELGLHQFDSELGENGSGLHREHCRLIEDTLQQVEALSDAAFQGDDWLDRRGFLSMVRSARLQNVVLRRWRNNPQQHCDTAVQSIFGLVIRNATRLAKVQPSIESRLAKIPRFLKQGLGLLDRPVPLWSELAAKTCTGFVKFLQELRKPLAAASKDPQKTDRLLADAARAFAHYADAVRDLPPGDENGFSIGRDHFEFLIRERLGLPCSLPEARSLGQTLIVQLTAEVEREARKFGRRPAGAVLEEAAAEWQPRSNSLLEEYRQATGEIRDLCEKKKLLTLPQREVLNVLVVPEFLSHQFPTAAYMQPGPFEKRQVGIFWVNDLSRRQREPEKQAAEIRQHFGLELTCAHEAYPGHHAQFVIQNRHPSKLRRLFAHAIFYEGWTLWCERMCVEQKLVRSPYARLMQLHDALWRAYRIVIDCGLHSGELSFAKASRKLVEGAGFTESRARGDVSWYTSSPSVPMSYLIGRLELERLHARLTGEYGWTLQKFNDWVLSFGAIPWSWIWESQLRPGPGGAPVLR